MSDPEANPPRPAPSARVAEVFWAFLKLGLTSFGGPVAHLGYFHAELVERRRWLHEESYAHLMALCQLLPGPTSSQVGMAIGLMRAGPAGMLAAWVGFTLPSAIVMVVFAYGLSSAGGFGGGWLGGLKVAAVAIVADAVLTMARSLTPDRARRSLALLAAAAAAVFPGALGQIAIIAGGALAGLFLLRLPDSGAPAFAVTGDYRPGRYLALGVLMLFAGLLVVTPLVAAGTGNGGLALFDTFYRAGSLVFGGGHVVLPLIEAEMVGEGGLSREVFLAGYGAVQAVPGPLFSFAAYVGALMPGVTQGLAGAVIALVAMFLPSMLLVLGAMRYWNLLAARQGVRNALAGVNAAVVGLLGAALWDPVATSSIGSPLAFALAVLAYLALALWRVPPWAVVCGAAFAGGLML